MSAQDQWQENNAQRLAAALADLRDRLARAAPRAPANDTPAPPPAEPVRPASVIVTPPPPSATMTRKLFQRMLRAPADPPLGASALPPTHPEVVPSGPEPAAPPTPEPNPPAAAADSDAVPAPEPWAMDMLASRLGLSDFEQKVLLLCAAQELDTRIAGLCARAQDDPQKPFPTFALALAIFDNPAWEALAPERPLRYWRLIEIHQPASLALTASALRADERIVNFLKGLNYLDDRLSPLFSALELTSGSVSLGRTQEEQVDSILHGWQQVAASGPLPAVQLIGSDPLSKQLIAYHVASQLNRRLYRLNAELLPSAAGELELLARLWQRESRLLPLALYFDAEEISGPDAERSGPVSRFLSRSDGIFFVGVREFNARLGRAQQAVDVVKPTVAEQQAAWEAALGPDVGDAPARLAAQFNLNLPSIEILAGVAHTQAAGDSRALADTAWSVSRTSERPRLDSLAQRLEPKVTWDDLVLPKAETDLLRQIAAQAAQRNRVYAEWGFDRKMNRGFGISALFAGESGTGKTMAAEVIANDLRLNLYRIDLSQVVNKYIGETEKNLRRLFDAAEDGGAILFFDEADALFGKRSEVKDSHDRYANIEINYLLQRMESYRGLAILATNLQDRPRPGLHAAAPVHRQFLLPRRAGAPPPLVEGVPAAGRRQGASRAADRRARLRPPGRAQPHRRPYSQCRPERRVPGGAPRDDDHHAARPRGGAGRVPQTGPSRQRVRFQMGRARRGQTRNPGGRIDPGRLSGRRRAQPPSILSETQNQQTAAIMPKYVIERELPGAGSLTGDQLHGISQKSCNVLRNLGPEIQWVQSFVTADKIYCVYIAPNEALIREHARQGGFPATRVSKVTDVIDPTTAEVA